MKLTDVKQIASTASDKAIAEIRNSLARRSRVLNSSAEEILRAALDKLIETCLTQHIGVEEDEC